MFRRGDRQQWRSQRLYIGRKGDWKGKSVEISEGQRQVWKILVFTLHSHTFMQHLRPSQETEPGAQLTSSGFKGTFLPGPCEFLCCSWKPLVPFFTFSPTNPS